jgi:alpha-L-fucosidase
LEPLVIRPFAIEEDDQLYTIERTYAYRPDLLSFDLYGTPRLWWVFAQRNPDQIEDPIYDFKPGVVIQLPKQATVTRDLGI